MSDPVEDIETLAAMAGERSDKCTTVAPTVPKPSAPAKVEEPKPQLSAKEQKRRLAALKESQGKAHAKTPTVPTPAQAAPTGGGFPLSKQERDDAELAELFKSGRKLGDFLDPTPDDENPKAVFKEKYLRFGQLLLFVSTLGSGKSTFVSQASECWARGLPFMGITPARRLKIAVFETEDDADEIADFRNNFRRGFAEDGWTRQEIRDAELGEYAPMYCPTGYRSGDAFIKLVEYNISRAPCDLVLINPFYDFIGGDMSKSDEVKEFLAKLMRLAEKYGFAVLIVHHTNKVPSNAKERSDWLTGDAAAYAGSGSMVLPSSARAVMFMRSMDVQGYYELIAAKRGKRLGWTDANGNPTTLKYIAHSDGYIYWRTPTHEEVETVNAVKKAGGNKMPTVNHDADVVKVCETNKKPFSSKNQLYAAMTAQIPCSPNSARAWVSAALKSHAIVERENEDSTDGSISIGLESQFPPTMPTMPLA